MCFSSFPSIAARYFCALSILLSSLTLFGQDRTSLKLQHELPELTFKNQDAIFSWVKKQANRDLRFEDKVVRPHTTHYRFQQEQDGLDVHHGECIVSVSPTGRLVRFYDAVQRADIAPKPSTLVSANDARDAAWEHLHVQGHLRSKPSMKLCYRSSGEILKQTWCVTLSLSDPNGAWDVWVDPNGKVTQAVNQVKGRGQIPKIDPSAGPSISFTEALNAFEAREQQEATELAEIAENDSNLKAVVTANVFDPDPVTTLGGQVIFDASPASAFTPALVSQTLQDVTFSGGLYRLIGPYVRLQDLQSPNTPPTTSSSANWNFSRGQAGLNDATAYFHIDQNQRYVQSLGFTSLQNGSIRIDTDANNGEDNSYFDGNANVLLFGKGGIDDTEDADVILHEYFHALQQDMVPSIGAGDWGAIGEGMADVWAASYSSTTPNGLSFEPNIVFNWDGNGEYFRGRRLDVNVLYDPSLTYFAHQQIGLNAPNQSDELFSAPVWQTFLYMHQVEGRDRSEMDRILIEANLGLGAGVTMRAMAREMVSTARNLFPNEKHAAVYMREFVERNILLDSGGTFISPGASTSLSTGSTIPVIWTAVSEPNAGMIEVEYAPDCDQTPYLNYDMENAPSWTVEGDSGVWSLVNFNGGTAWLANDSSPFTDSGLVMPAVNVFVDSELSFVHEYRLESAFDGAVVEYSLNNGAWLDLGPFMTQNGYNSAVDTAFSNPLTMGQKCFSGWSPGVVKTTADLSSFIGQSLRLRFRIGTDSGTRELGWWIDDIQIQVRPMWAPVTTLPGSATSFNWTVPGPATVRGCLRMRLTEFGTWKESPLLEVNVSNSDTDGDGMPNTWETANGLSPTVSNATQDADGDGVSNLDEYLADTDPQNASDYLRVVNLDLPGNIWQLSFPTKVGKTYYVQRAVPIDGTWGNVAAGIVGTGGVVQQNVSGPDKAYFRIGVQ